MNDPPGVLALLLDRPDDPDGFYWTLFFVSRVDQGIARLDVRTGAFMTVDDDLIQTNTVHKTFTDIAPRGTVEIERDDAGAFDSVVWFSIHLTCADQSRRELSFSLPKGAPSHAPEDVPELGGPAIVFRADDGTGS